MAATTDVARIPAGSTIAGPEGQRIGIRQALQGLESPGAQNRLSGRLLEKNLLLIAVSLAIWVLVKN